MDAKILIVSQTNIQEAEIDVIFDATSSVQEPLIIQYEEKPDSTTCIQMHKTITVEVLGPFPYKNNQVVPWKYECQLITNNVASVTTGGITRSGRCYTPYVLKDISKEDEVRRRKGKAMEMIGGDDLSDLSKVFTAKTTLAEKKINQEVVSKKESLEFLKLIKRSEYKVIEQLHRTPARISILSLFMYSEPHRKVLLDILNRAHVGHDISVNALSEIVENITAINCISFIDEEIPP